MHPLVESELAWWDSFTCTLSSPGSKSMLVGAQRTRLRALVPISGLRVDRFFHVRIEPVVCLQQHVVIAEVDLCAHILVVHDCLFALRTWTCDFLVGTIYLQINFHIVLTSIDAYPP